MLAFFAIAVLFCGNFVAAQEVINEIPDSVPEHTLVVLEGKEGSSWTWIIRRLPDGFRPRLLVRDKGRECIWTAPPGKYDIDVIALYEDGLIQGYRQISIDGVDTPDPDPKPDPDPDTPDPDVPDPEAPEGFAGIVFEWANAVDDPQGAQALSVAYQQIAGALADNTLNVTTAVAELGKVSDAALRNASGDWTRFRENVTNELRERQQRSLIRDNATLHNFLADVADGLGAASAGKPTMDLPSLFKIVEEVNQIIDGAK